MCAPPIMRGVPTYRSSCASSSATRRDLARRAPSASEACWEHAHSVAASGSCLLASSSSPKPPTNRDSDARVQTASAASRMRHQFTSTSAYTPGMLLGPSSDATRSSVTAAGGNASRCIDLSWCTVTTPQHSTTRGEPTQTHSHTYHTVVTVCRNRLAAVLAAGSACSTTGESLSESEALTSACIA